MDDEKCEMRSASLLKMSHTARVSFPEYFSTEIMFNKYGEKTSLRKSL
jgi:hypothetical protein